jgi:hypothetical protein
VKFRGGRRKNTRIYTVEPYRTGFGHQPRLKGL